MNRWDETWHRLLEWTSEQGPSERLAQQVVLADGFSSVDPSHPLGGPDSGCDARCSRNGEPWCMAVYFPRGQQSFSDIKNKFAEDLGKARVHDVAGIVFVTNQELRLGERRELINRAQPNACELYHLERVTTILDQPTMAGVRSQFLAISEDLPSVIVKGGEGGRPGGGGGGGAAVGYGARGGDGGAGGDSGGGGGGGGGGACGPLIPDFDETSLQAPALLSTWISPLIPLGEGGEGGDSAPARPARALAEVDIAAGIRCSLFGPANSVQLENGLLNLTGIGWEQFNCGLPPWNLEWHVACGLSKPHADTSADRIALWLVAQDPKERIVAREPIVIEGGAWTFRCSLVPLRLPLAVPGMWRLSLCSGPYCLAAMSIEVRCSVGPDSSLG